MVGAQAEGAAPIVNGSPVADPKTVASAIKIGNPASWEGATSARDESGGAISAVTDIEILSAQIRLAGSEGLFAEPASAAPLARTSATKSRCCPTRRCWSCSASRATR